MACEECKGTGVYVGLGFNPAEPCRMCASAPALASKDAWQTKKLLVHNPSRLVAYKRAMAELEPSGASAHTYSASEVAALLACHMRHGYLSAHILDNEGFQFSQDELADIASQALSLLPRAPGSGK